MDLDTFLTQLYVWIDDWYQSEMRQQVARRYGPPPRLSDSEVLTIAIAGQWGTGMPWQSERGVVRYMQSEGRAWFPQMLSRSRFNERVRCLWTVLIQLHHALAEALGAANSLYEVVDCVPLPSCSNAQARKPRHWLWWGTYGHGGTQGGSYWGDQLVVSVSPQAVITGWGMGPAHTDDRAMLQGLLSARHGETVFTSPAPWRPWRKVTIPSSLGPPLAAGRRAVSGCYLADKGFNGFNWQRHWYQQFGVSVVTEPAANAQGVVFPPRWRRWFRRLRQKVETTFAVLCQHFRLKRLNAHSRWGQYTRVALALTAFNWGIWLNRHAGRRDLTHATLLC